MIIPLKDGETLARFFHINSEPWSNSEPYLDSTNYEVEYKDISGRGEPVTLPAPDNSALLQLLSMRKSCRGYRVQSMSLETLSNILKCAYGITRLEPMPGIGEEYYRTVPSGGGLFPLEIYVLAREIDGLSEGIYHYNVRRHSLELVRAGSWSHEIDSIMVSAPFIANANLIFLLSAVFKRSLKKYGPRGYRYIHLEAGHVAQNLCLIATEQQLGSLCMGGFTDSKLNRFMGLDGVKEGVIYSVAVGHPA